MSKTLLESNNLTQMSNIASNTTWLGEDNIFSQNNIWNSGSYDKVTSYTSAEKRGNLNQTVSSMNFPKDNAWNYNNYNYDNPYNKTSKKANVTAAEFPKGKLLKYGMGIGVAGGMLALGLSAMRGQQSNAQLYGQQPSNNSNYY